MLIKKLIIVMHYISKWKQFLMVEDDMDSHEVAKASIVTNDNKVLILKRSDYMMDFAGEWDLPGGHLKQSEKTEIGLDREVLEETGLNIGPYDHEKIITIDNIHFYLIRYNKQSNEINVNISDEHTDFAFVSQEELQNFDISEKFTKVINKSMGFED
tara:strand:+ start:195 stop:665 length:471 start_codon:yes stop_codon:yes gene_type:complete